jgi:hypothetical protein
MTFPELAALLTTQAAYLTLIAWLAWLTYHLATDDDNPKENANDGPCTIQPRPPDRL